MIGGLLFRYWDSGRLTAPVPPPTDDLPPGVENSGYPNIRAKWARKDERDAKREAALAVERAEAEQDATPVPLPVVGRPAVAAPSAAVPMVRARHTARVAPCALAKPDPAQIDARLVPVPILIPKPAGAAPTCARPGIHLVAAGKFNRYAQTLAAQVLGGEPAPQAALAVSAEQRRRNQRAIELALRLLDDEEDALIDAAWEIHKSAASLKGPTDEQ